MKSYQCDVLVVGAGGAGLRAAIAAKEENAECRVLLVTKGKPGQSGVTANACSDRMAFHATLDHTEPGQDAWQYHALDIFDIGGRVSDYDLAVTLAKGSRDAFWYLHNLGVPFVIKDGKPDQFITDGSQYARACYTGPKTAIHIEEALVKRFHQLNLPVVEETAVYRLVKHGGKVAGAFGIGPEDEPVVFHAGAVVLATGGAGEIYKHSVFWKGAAGDACALALQAGVPVVNMEFIQIGICSVKTKLACSGSLMRAVPRFINDKGEEFLGRYLNHMEVPDTVFEKGASWPVSLEHCSHIIDVAVFYEIMNGCRVYLDYSKDPDDFDFNQLSDNNRGRFEQEVCAGGGMSNPLDRLRRINPASIQWLKEQGVDLENGEPIEIIPAIQHFQGGIKIRTNAETSIDGLYAAGECAGGQHGANRPGGNSLMDCQVFGKIAGENAARFASESAATSVQDGEVASEEDTLSRIRRSDGDISVDELKSSIRNTMSRYVSVVRTEEGLKSALRLLDQLKNARLHLGDAGLADCFEAQAMLITAEAVTRAALERPESRGPHLRFEYPGAIRPIPRSPDWERYILIHSSHGVLTTRVMEPVKPD